MVRQACVRGEKGERTCLFEALALVDESQVRLMTTDEQDTAENWTCGSKWVWQKLFRVSARTSGSGVRSKERWRSASLLSVSEYVTVY